MGITKAIVLRKSYLGTSSLGNSVILFSDSDRITSDIHEIV